MGETELRRVALDTAVRLAGLYQVTAADVLKEAEAIYQWLIKNEATK